MTFNIALFLIGMAVAIETGEIGAVAGVVIILVGYNIIKPNKGE